MLRVNPRRGLIPLGFNFSINGTVLPLNGRLVFCLIPKFRNCLKVLTGELGKR